MLIRIWSNWSNYYLAIYFLSSQCVSNSHQLIQITCAMSGDYHIFNSIFDWITQWKFSYCFIGLAFVGICRPTCLSSLLAAFRLNDTGTLLFKEILSMFSYILVVSRDYILLISICPRLKARKVHIIASCAILVTFIKNYFKRAKIWWLFAQLYRNSTDCFVIKLDTVSRF